MNIRNWKVRYEWGTLSEKVSEVKVMTSDWVGIEKERRRRHVVVRIRRREDGIAVAAAEWVCGRRVLMIYGLILSLLLRHRKILLSRSSSHVFCAWWMICISSSRALFASLSPKAIFITWFFNLKKLLILYLIP